MFYRDENNEWQEIILEPSGDTLPIGAITQFSGSIAPTNWLFCNGQAISRTEYSELFAIIGTHYGEGDGSTTFNLPDFIGRVPVGLDAEDPDFDALGDFGGEKTHTLTINEMPSHAHEELAISNPNSGGSGIRGTYNGEEGSGMSRYSTNAQTGTTGGSQPHNIVQPYLVTNFIIKAKQSVGLVGVITNDIDDINVNAVPNAKTVKEKVEGDILYSDSTGTNGDITLSKSADNYPYKEIFFFREGFPGEKYENSVKISGNRASLMTHFTNTNVNQTTVSFKNITFSGASLTVNSYQEWNNIWGSNGVAAGNDNKIYITKVLGYK